jgi:hypothetical protein
VVEQALLVAAVAGVGLIRPRWSSLFVACVPAVLAGLWLFLHEDVPGEEIGAGDVAWYLGMSAAVAVAFALACALGIVAGLAIRRLAR